MKTVRILTQPPVAKDDNWLSVQASYVTPSHIEREPMERSYFAYTHAVIRDLLGRESNPIERQNWVEQLLQGTRAETIPLCLLYSAEYRSISIRRIFERTFKRPPSWDELQKWSEAAANGKTFEQVWAEMLSTEEYLRRNGASNETFVRALFRDVLDRRPDFHEAEGWRGLLDAFAATRESLTEQFLQSREYKQQQIRRWSETYLGRGASVHEIATYLVKWEQGHPPEKMQAEMLASAEYFLRRLRRLLA